MVACETAARTPITYGPAEEMIVVTPDQVIASRYTARPAVETAKRLGVHVLDLDVPNTIDAMRQEMDECHAFP